MTLSKSIINEVENNKTGSSESTLWAVLQGISPFLIGINLPASIILFVISSTIEVVLDKKSLSTRPMSDKWLKKVSESENVSTKGSRFLSKKLTQKGFVSVSDALTFLDIENQSEQKENKKQEFEFKEGSGADRLLKRFQKELDSDSNIQSLFTRFNEFNNFIDHKKLIGKGRNIFKHPFNSKGKE